MDFKQLVLLALQVSVIGTVFGFGLEASIEDLGHLARRPGLLARSFVSVFVLMPVVAVMLVRSLDFPHTTEVVLIALAVCPVPPLLPTRQGKAGGQLSYGLALVALLSLASIVTIPATEAILQHLFGRPLAISPAAIAKVVLKTTLVPLAAGVAVHTIWPAAARRLGTPARVVSNVLLPLAVVVLLAGAYSAIWAAVGNGTVLAIVIFTVAGLAIGHLLGGPGRGERVVLAFSTACRHPALAVAIATNAFPDERFGATMLLYLLVNILAGMPYLVWQRRMAAAA